MDILIGCDPEIFVSRDGKPVSAHGIIPGNKKEPHKVNKGAVQVDGMALEFNIDPASNYRAFSYNIDKVLGQLRSMVPEDLQFQVTPVAYFDDDYIKAQPDEATELGCEPDYNAYTGQVNPTPDGTRPFRTASGHIHIGWTEGMDIRDPEHKEACEMLVKQLDATVGLVSLLWDKDHKRRELYGMPGAYRPKPYGVEYRVLSNMWLKDKLFRKAVWACVKYSFDKLLDGKKIYKNTHLHTFADRFLKSNLSSTDAKIIVHIKTILRNLVSDKYITEKEYNKLKHMANELSGEADRHHKAIQQIDAGLIYATDIMKTRRPRH